MNGKNGGMLIGVPPFFMFPTDKMLKMKSNALFNTEKME